MKQLDVYTRFLQINKKKMYTLFYESDCVETGVFKHWLLLSNKVLSVLESYRVASQWS